MLHHIIVKWNPTVDRQDAAIKVRAMYAKATKLPGIHHVAIRENIIPRDNRYDLMIVLDMERTSLPIWDESPLHQQWKAEFGTSIEKKCIFDCETV